MYALAFFLGFWAITISFTCYVDWKRGRRSKVRVRIVIRSNYFDEHWVSVHRNQMVPLTANYSSRSAAKRAASKWAECFVDSIIEERYYNRG